MKINLHSLLLLFICLGFTQNMLAQKPLQPENFCVEKITLDPEKGKITLTIYNKGPYFSYPIVVPIQGEDTLANAQRIFDYYGQLEDSRQDYTFPTSLKKLPKDFACTVLLADGMNRRQFIRLPYPCTGNQNSPEKKSKPKKKKKSKGD